MTTPLVDRPRIVAALAAAVGERDWIRAAWLGGSDATGRTDAWSDVDLQVIVEDDRVEDAFVALEAALSALCPVDLRHRLPEPTWHGHAQCFYRLRDASPHHFVDLVVLKRGAPGRFLEPERHGTPQVLVDREGLLAPVALDRAAHARRLRERLATLREIVPLFQPLAVRAVARGHAAEAAYWFQNLSLKPLVEVLRMRHCPDRFDFGFRYLDRDLPPEARALVEELAYPADPDALERARQRATARFVEELAALDRGEWTLP